MAHDLPPVSSDPSGEPTYLGKYRVLARLGTGGMAEVLLGRFDGPAGFSKYVAIKRMRPELISHQEFVDLFLEEAKTAALLNHPNICQVNELSAEGDSYYMVLEYLEGVSLSSLLAKAIANPYSLPVRLVAGVVKQACEGLHHAHDAADEAGQPYNIIHRDVSPPNLFVTTEGIVKVLDFGISKSRDSVVKTLTGQIRGKFAYMSPEQLRGETLDRRSDVFSLAIVLFELLTGQRLFRRKTRIDVFRAIVKERIPSAGEIRSDIPSMLVAALDQALGRDRNERFATADAFAKAIGSSLRTLGGVMPPREIGNVVRELCRSELESRRQVLMSPPGFTPPVSPAFTSPTSRLRPSKPTRHVPPGPSDDDVLFVDEEDLSDGDPTSVDLFQWPRGDSTVVDPGPHGGEPDSSPGEHWQAAGDDDDDS